MRIELVRGKEMESATAVMRRMRGKKKSLLTKLFWKRMLSILCRLCYSSHCASGCRK